MYSIRLLMKLNNTGISLIQISIFATILAGLALVGMRVANTQNTVIQKFYINFDVKQFMDAYEAHFSNRIHCAKTLKNIVAASASSAGTSFTQIRFEDYITPGGRVVFDTASAINNRTFGKVEVTSLSLRKSTTSGKVQVIFQYRYKLDGVTKTDTQAILLNASLDGLNRVQECYHDEESYEAGACTIFNGGVPGSFNATNGTCEKAFFPDKTIIGFFQSSCPPGWQVASAANIGGTVDVRGKFILGANSSLAGIGTTAAAFVARHNDHLFTTYANSCNRSYNSDVATHNFCVKPSNLFTSAATLLNNFGSATPIGDNRPINIALTFCIRKWR
ncbi:MAG: hypothetical protein HQK52_13675 [Oligoflexia bacterium]|nr:hypothetical protein [Oligoflexia bacterium]